MRKPSDIESPLCVRRASRRDVTDTKAFHGTQWPILGLPQRRNALSLRGANAASTVSAVSQSARPETGRLGGKVVDIPGLHMVPGVPDAEKAAQIEARINEAMSEKYGEVKVFGYHVTPEANVNSIRNEGFSAEKNQGAAGGIAGMNIRGAGLYMSHKPCSDYASPDQTSVMFALVAPKDIGLKESLNSPGKLWDAKNEAADTADGDFIVSGSDSYKINPGSINKFGLVQIVRLEPRMSKEILAERAAMTAKPQAPKQPTEKLKQWVSEHAQNEPSLNNLNGLSFDQKLEKFNTVANRLVATENAPSDAIHRLVMISLKSLYLSEAEIAAQRGVPGNSANARQGVNGAMR
ncbi:hypothetical protein PQQ86_32660 [Paraburkholderia sediminicola]|uniref:hypothetical protein n=1 Tax=Paraburkholderia sediminicola TaxID=458836 RepID=UPI0038B86BD0